MRMVIFAFIAALILAGCSSYHATRGVSGETGSIPSPKEYRIQPGDLLDVKFFYNPELNEQLTVRSDGKITLQLVNDVTAAGLTPAELTAVLTKAFAPELTNPRVAVIVRTSVLDKVYVDGEVNKAGMVNLTGPTTALQAIAQAGGMRASAKPEEVIVLRRSEERKVAVIRINLQNVLSGTDSTQDIQLKPNDVVFVPRSVIANINAWVDTYIRKNIPLPIGIGYNLN